MSIYLPFRVYMISSLISLEFADKNFRNRFAAALAGLSSDDSLVQEAFLEFIWMQEDNLNIEMPTTKNLIKFEKERYSFFLSASAVRLEKEKDEAHKILHEYLAEGSARINKFIYIHNYINHPDFLFLVYFSNLIAYDDFRVAKYITRLSPGLTAIKDNLSYDYLKEFKARLEKRLYLLKTYTPLDVSQYDPIFTIATN